MKIKKSKNMFFGGPKNAIILTFLLLGSLALLHKLTDYSRNIQTISYTAFLDKVELRQVKKVTIAGQEVFGVFTDGNRFETVVGNNQKDWDKLRENGVEVSVDNLANQFNIWYLFPLFSFLFMIGIVLYFIRQSRSGSGGGGGSSIFTMGKSRARMFMPSTIKENFDSVAGVAEAKEDLADVVDFLKNPKKYERLGAKIPRGVLLIGEPGNGKTLLARAVAGETNCPFFSISGSDFIEVFVGVGAARVRDLFVQARKHAPCIVFIDEIDAVGRHRGSGLGGGHDEREQTLNQLLTEMDGFQQTNANVIVIAATNRPDVLDKALLRPGRFDRRVDVPYPDLKSREEILQVHVKGVKISPTVDLKKIARGTPGFSGADLSNLINEAAIIASKKNQKDVDVNNFEEARDNVLLGKEIKSRMLTIEDKKMIAYHEGGHTLVQLLLPDVTDPLHKVTIIPRGRSLGVTHSLPEREKYITTKEEMLASIATALGGRAAEELVFGKLTTGAYSDFKKATDIARGMVCNYGMVPEIGSVMYSQSHGDFAYSQSTAEKIDQEVQKIINKCHDKALNLLKTNRDKLDKLVEALLDKETMYAGEIYSLLEIEPRTEHSFL